MDPRKRGRRIEEGGVECHLDEEPRGECERDGCERDVLGPPPVAHEKDIAGRERRDERNDADGQVDARHVADRRFKKVADVRQAARRHRRVAAYGRGNVVARSRSRRGREEHARRNAEEQGVLSEGPCERTPCPPVRVLSQQHGKDRRSQRGGSEDDELDACKDREENRNEQQRIAPQRRCPDRLEHRPDAHETERIREVLAHRERRVAHDRGDDGKARHEERQSARQENAGDLVRGEDRQRDQERVDDLEERVGGRGRRTERVDRRDHERVQRGVGQPRVVEESQPRVPADAQRQPLVHHLVAEDGGPVDTHDERGTDHERDEREADEARGRPSSADGSRRSLMPPRRLALGSIGGPAPAPAPRSSSSRARPSEDCRRAPSR